MKRICSVLILSSFLNGVLAYPFDYNETAVIETDELLNNLRLKILEPKFSDILQGFYSQVSATNRNIYAQINATRHTYALALNEIKEKAINVNADIAECIGDEITHQVDTLYISYDRDCVVPFANVGENIITIGYNTQQVVFLRKYSQLMDHYRGCITPGDPAPKFCAGVIAGTVQEVQRIFPIAKTYALDAERQARKEIINLSECGNTHISLANQKLQNQFDKIRECILSKIIVAPNSPK